MRFFLLTAAFFAREIRLFTTRDELCGDLERRRVLMVKMLQCNNDNDKNDALLFTCIGM